MTQATEPNLNRIDAGNVRQQLAGKHVCPFCGVIRADQTQPCPRCTMEDTNATRSATRQRIGPWFVLQARNPSAPGMKFATLLSLAKKGHVTPRSIVRGPTTHQLWTFAARVRGLSREFGLCAYCGESIEPAAAACRHCDRSQEPPADPDALLEQGAPTAPELSVSAAATSEAGMDGGTSLDLQADDGFGLSVTRPARPAAPSVTSNLPVSVTAPRSAGPERVAKPQPEEAILSARELAAAFQLEFKQPAGAAPAQNRAAASTARTPVIDNPAQTKGGWFKTFVALLLIAVIAAGIVLVLRPDLRERTVTWLTETWGSIKTSLEAPAGKPVAPTPKPDAPKSPPSVKPEQPKPKSAVVERPAAPSTPAPKPEPAPAPKPSEVVKVEPKPEPPPPAPKPAVVKAPEPPPVVRIDPNLTLEQAIDLAKDWRNRAIDAEGRRDWSAALNLYEQIEKLPRDAWPADLQLRLERIRAKAR